MLDKVKVHPQLRQAILRLIAARLPSGVSFGPFLMAAPPPSDSPSEDFGPFIAIGSQLIQPAGWKCKGCGKPVRVLKQVVPVIIERLIVYACNCGATVHWEDEKNLPKKAGRSSSSCSNKPAAKSRSATLAPTPHPASRALIEDYENIMHYETKKQHSPVPGSGWSLNRN
jgi:hypothetical protein